MGYALTVYAVPLEKLLAAPGSGRDRFVQREGVLGSVRRNDAGRSSLGVFEGDDPPNRLEDAVAQILDGDELNPRRGAEYGYAVEALCRYLGTAIYTPVGFPRPDDLDEFLEPLGCPVSLRGLIGGRSPIPIPNPDDFPFIGCWSPEQVAAAKDFFDRLQEDRSAEALALGVREVRDWLRVATDPVSPAARWLRGAVGRNPDEDLFKRLLRREEKQNIKPKALIGFWY